MNSRAGRTLAAALAVTALLAAAGLIGYRVLAPAEVLHPATAAAPPPAAADTGVVGRLLAVPLIVDDRVRIHATIRQVRAEMPVDMRGPVSPHWSYRRWPAQLSGVVAVGTTVVSRWSDGRLTALDAYTGRVRWRADGPTGSNYTGRRTGAGTVLAPVGLHTAGATLLVADDGQLVAYDAGTGAERWRVAVPPGCAPGGFTTVGDRYVCADGSAAYDLARGRPDAHWPRGTAERIGCAPAASECPAMRITDAVGRTTGWRLTGAGPLPLPALDALGSWLVGDVVVAPVGGAAPAYEWLATSVRTGEPNWRWWAPTRQPAEAAVLLAAQPGRLHLLTGGRDLVTLDTATGAERSRFVLVHRRDRIDWTPGQVAAAAGLVAVERLADPADPTADDSAYYFSAETVLLAAT